MRVSKWGNSLAVVADFLEWSLYQRAWFFKHEDDQHGHIAIIRL
jgi:hypothetical protein